MLCTLIRRVGPLRLRALLMLALLPSFVIPVHGAAATSQSMIDPAYTSAEPVLEGLPHFEPAKCGFTLDKGDKEGSSVNCGFVVVPEHHGNPSGATIRLAVARFRGTGKTTAAEPIIYLEGGPGGGSLDSSASTFAAHYTAGHDLILFDQRGVGQSQPSLNCPEVATQYSRDIRLRERATEEEEHTIAALIRCHDRLAAKYDLTAYTTAENAADVSDIRLALGYEKVNLLGVSYGSYLALAVMRDFPQIVASALIDAVVPPQRDHYGDFAVNLDHALNLVFASCAADQSCNSSFPAFRADFSQVVATLNAKPLTVTTNSGDWGDNDPRSASAFIFTGDRLVQFMLQYLYAASSIRYLPMLIAQLKGGDPSLLRALLRASSNDLSSSFSQGMLWSVRCSDYLHSVIEMRYWRRHETCCRKYKTGYLPSELSGYVICPQWGSAPPNPIENRAVTSDVPTLVLSSANDPVTPPSYAQAAAQTLSHSIYVEGPGIGHSLIGNGGACAEKIARDFFANPNVRPDTACINAQRVRFLTNLKHYAAPPPFAIDTTKKYTATIVTTKGTITFDLLATVAPRPSIISSSSPTIISSMVWTSTASYRAANLRPAIRPHWGLEGQDIPSRMRPSPQTSITSAGWLR